MQSNILNYKEDDINISHKKTPKLSFHTNNCDNCDIIYMIILMIIVLDMQRRHIFKY